MKRISLLIIIYFSFISDSIALLSLLETGQAPIPVNVAGPVPAPAMPQSAGLIPFGAFPGGGGIVTALDIGGWDNGTFEDAANEVFNNGLPPGLSATIAAAGIAIPLVGPVGALGAAAILFPAGLPAASVPLLNDYIIVENAINGVPGFLNSINAPFAGGVLTIAHFVNFLDCVSKRSREGENVPHLALARVVVYDAANNAFAYPVPYVFISSGGGPASFANIRAQALADFNAALAAAGAGPLGVGAAGAAVAAIAAGGVVPPEAINLHIANSIIGPAVAMPLGNICVGILNYIAGATSMASYAHSERAIALCLDDGGVGGNFLANVIAAHNALYPVVNAVARVIIQIKTSRPICEHCQDLWRDNAHFVPPNTFCGHNNIGGIGNVYTINASLNAIAVGFGLAAGSVWLRVSSRPHFLSW
ncbi:MAG: hypothetical protein LBC04_02325 [Holosporaceae bacterium]|jgi:hypothetical protein|nr:hypothetical protein [Holosporaceae bacterium]